MAQQNDKTERYYDAYLTHNTISRRGLFRSFFRGTTQETVEQRNAPRPPFAAKESLFVAICNGCGDCAAACPYGLIQLKENKPTLDIDFSACDFCRKCADACSTQALHIAFPADTELRPVFSSQCLMKKGQFCDTCQSKCPQNAISFEHKSPIIAENCNGCGECKVSCFVGAVSLAL